jgi:GAF domain-containing protein
VHDLRWSWLAAPYLVCTVVIATVVVAAALTRGDRVMRLGVMGAAVTAVPWALCQAAAACTTDPIVATKLLRLGQGPVALVGPCLMIVLLGASGQLERYRWVARLSGVVGGLLLFACWATPWTVPGVQVVPAGMYYTAVGPLTGVHISQLVVWLAVGYAIARRASPRGEGKRTTRLVLAVLVFGAVGSLDTLLLYGIWGSYPIAWLPATMAAGIAVYLVLRTDLIRPQGFDRAIAVETGTFLAAAAAAGVAAVFIGTSSPLALAGVGAIAWTVATALAWRVARSQPVRVAEERSLEQFVARATRGDEKKLAERLVELWKTTLGIEVKTIWACSHEALGELVEIGGKGTWSIPDPVVVWLATFGEPFAISEIGTMPLRALRSQVEAVVEAHGASLLVPLVDRDELVGLVEANYERALRDDERVLVGESARAAARGLTFFSLARAASRERSVAREVEIADALRLQASASRDAELGRWVVAAEYRTAPRTTGAGWSAIELADGRLALLVTEAQAHGVAAALATAALTGAFAAATSGPTRVSIEDMLQSMRASSEGVMRGGEPVAAFFALLDAETKAIEWATAGHPGALLVGPIASVEHGLPDGSVKRAKPNAIAIGMWRRVPGASIAEAMHARNDLPPDTLLVVASSALRGDRDEAWQETVRELAPSGGRLATSLVERALQAGEPDEDLLAVVVRAR